MQQGPHGVRLRMKIWEQSSVILGWIAKNIHSREDKGGVKEHSETGKVILLKNEDEQGLLLKENSNINKREGGQTKE